MLGLVACSSDAKKVDLGDDNSDSTALGLAAYEGVWDGHVEARQFQSGSDRVRITLDAEGHGNIELGDAPAFAPFTDPSVGYPTEWSYDDPNFPTYAHSDAQEGFAYPVQDAQVTHGRLSFSFWLTDLVKDWCAAQTALLDNGSMPPRWACTSPGGFGWPPEGGCTTTGGAPGDCGRAILCNGVCACDSVSCNAQREVWQQSKLDGALTEEGDSLVGTLLLPPLGEGITGSGDFERVTVRVMR